MNLELEQAQDIADVYRYSNNRNLILRILQICSAKSSTVRDLCTTYALHIDVSTPDKIRELIPYEIVRKTLLSIAGVEQ